MSLPTAKNKKIPSLDVKGFMSGLRRVNIEIGWKIEERSLYFEKDGV